MTININELRYQKLMSAFIRGMVWYPATGLGRDADCKARSIQQQFILAAIEIVEANPDLNIHDVVDCIQREVRYACDRFKEHSTTYNKIWIDEE